MVAFNIKRSDQSNIRILFFSQFINYIILHCHFWRNMEYILPFWKRECYVIDKELFANTCFIRLEFWKPEVVAKSQENSISLTSPIHVYEPVCGLLTKIFLSELFHIYNPFTPQSAVSGE
jgi:hypothetical protein